MAIENSIDRDVSVHVFLTFCRTETDSGRKKRREGGRKGSCMLDKQQCYGVEKEMTAQSSIVAWRIPRTADPGGLQSMGLQRVRHN